MDDLDKVLKEIMEERKVEEKLFKIELEKEKHIQELFPAFAIQDKQVISEIVRQKVNERRSNKIFKAIEKKLGDIFG